MKEIVKVDLRIARQHSGLTSQDVATILGCPRTRLSKLENGLARPCVREIISLSIIYGRPLDSLFQLTSSRLTDKLRQNLAEMDFSLKDASSSSKVRLDTLNQLSDRLRLIHDDHD